MHKMSAQGQWRVAEDRFMGWMRKQPGTPPPVQGVTLAPGGPPRGCNCLGVTSGKACDQAGGAAWWSFTPAPTTTMMAPAQPPIMAPPPPPPLPGPPPPLPLAPAKPLPGLPGLPEINLNIMPTLGPPPLFKMTPAPTAWPVGGIIPITTPAPPTTAGPTTPAWVESPYGFGLIAGTTGSPYARFTTTRAWATTRAFFAPAPAPAPGYGLAFAQPVFAPVAPWSLMQNGAASVGSFLHRSLSGQSAVETCDCPCDRRSDSDREVDQGFENIMNMPR